MARQYYGEADDPNNPYDDSNQNMYPDVNAPVPGADNGTAPAPANDSPAPAPAPSGGGGQTGGGGGGGNGSTGGYTGALPAGVTQAQADAWLAKNPGDAGRMAAAFGNSTSRPDAPKGGSGGTGANGSSAMLQALLESILGGGALNGINQSAYQESPQSQAMRVQMMAALQEMIRQGQEPVGDVSNTPQAQANQIATQREYEHNRSAAAERRASQGLLFSGPFEQDINGAQQQRSEKQGAFEAQIVQTILNDRKERLTSALQMSAGILSEDQRVGLQRELQQVNAALQQTQLKIMLAGSLFQNQQFYDNLGYGLGGTEAAANAKSVGG